jgi:hypothetical protein
MNNNHNHNNSNNSARKRIVSLAVVATLVLVATVIGVSVAAAKRADRDRNTKSSTSSASSSSLRPVGSTGDVARKSFVGCYRTCVCVMYDALASSHRHIDLPTLITGPADKSANSTNATTTFVPAEVPEKTKVACCEPALEPGQFGNPFCTEGAACCPDGTWSCSIGDGVSFPCDNETLTSGFGERCDDDDEEEDDVDSDLVTTCCNPADEPGQFGNPFCTEGAACCPDGTWSCSIGDGVSFPCGNETLTSGFGERCDGDKEEEDVGDSDLVTTCCNPLEEPGQFGNPFCTEGAVCCPDGSWSCSIGDGVSFPCGGETITSGFGTACALDCEICPGGFFDGCNNCACNIEGGPICTLKLCGPDILEPKTCNQEQSLSPPAPKCCDPADEPGHFGNPFCTEGAACCPDGSWSCSIGDGVSFPCGGETITSGFGERCDDADDDDDSKPKCCDPADEPGQFGNPFCTEGAACCPDGTWSCSIGDGKSFPCGGETIMSGFGERCEDDDDDSKPKCCDAADEPGQFGNPFCTEGAACCPDGTWSCSIGDGKSFPCGGETITSGFGERCDDDDDNDDDDDDDDSDSTTCCDPLSQPGQFGNPFCIEGAVCCPDGTWSCSIGDGVSFPCGDKI